jgi:hypothetical protein
VLSQERSRFKDCSTRNCTVQAMLKAVDDVNGCKSRPIVVLKVLRYSTDGVTRVTVFCGKTAAKFAIDSEKVVAL